MVRKKKWISLREGIRKLTFMPAKRLKLSNKGRIQEGKDADVTIFDFKRIINRSQFGVNICASPPDGIDYVIINGNVAYGERSIKRTDLGRCILA